MHALDSSAVDADEMGVPLLLSICELVAPNSIAHVDTLHESRLE